MIGWAMAQMAHPATPAFTLNPLSINQACSSFKHLDTCKPTYATTTFVTEWLHLDTCLNDC